MNKSLSIYLDAARLCAAMTVFFGHLAGERFTDGLFWQFGPYMDEAVTVFFVISGFVIAHVVFDRLESRDEYVVARISRIASVVIPALAVTAVLDGIGQTLRPELYSASWGFSAEQPVLQYLGALLFLNRAWYADLNVGSNLPFWSLNFEIWYYILFGIAVFGRGRARIFGLVLAVAISGPVILSLLPVWLMGVVAQRCCSRGLLGPRAGLLLFLAAVVLTVLYLRQFGTDAGRLPALPDVFNRPLALHDFITGLLFAVSLVCFSAAAPLLSQLVLPLGGAVRWAAGATFSIYLFHLPVAQFLTTLVPWPPAHPLTRICMLGGTLLAAFLLAEVTERRKDWWKPLGRRLLAMAQHLARWRGGQLAARACVQPSDSNSRTASGRGIGATAP
jgi:peptidoglycan/LPS O-acetylase OafA/YrhL